MKKYLLVLLLIVFIVPSVALASWWNPLSWFNGWNFNKTEITTENPAQKITVPNTTTTNDVSSKIIIPTANTKQKNPPVVEKTTSQKDTAQPQKPIVVGCASTQDYSSTTGLSCSGNNSCINGSFFDKNTGSCINYLTYCQKQNGLNATYDSIKNSCSCATGYTLNSNNICSVPKTGYQICNEQFSNGTWDGTMANGKYNCVCQTGYVLNGAGTACVVVNQNQTQQLSSLQNQLQKLQNEYNQQCNSVISDSLSATRGQQVVAVQAEIATCNSLTQQENNIQQEIYNLEQ